MSPFLNAFAGVVLVSVLSLVGVFSLVLGKNLIFKIVHMLVPLAVGSLIGGAVLHLLPEATDSFGGFTTELSFYFMGGILAFWIIVLISHHICKNSRKSIS